jgi:hypothetical protein
VTSECQKGPSTYRATSEKLLCTSDSARGGTTPLHGTNGTHTSQPIFLHECPCICDCKPSRPVYQRESAVECTVKLLDAKLPDAA